MQLFKHAFVYKDIPYDVEHYFSSDFETSGITSFEHLEKTRVEKVHAICKLDNKIALVGHANWNVFGLPGGSVEEGEAPEETLRREVLEETNCEIITMQPFAYQKVISTKDGSFTYRLIYLCDVVKLGEFESDIAGSVDRVVWIDPKEYENYIEEKAFRRVVFEVGVQLLSGVAYYNW